MTTSFRQRFTVIKRNMGEWIDGIYIPNDDYGVREIIFATIQEPNVGDRNIIEANPYGKRMARYIKIYTNTKLRPVSQNINGEPSYPGDLIIFEDRPYLIFGESNFNMLAKTRPNNVSHWRYFACEVIENAAMEHAP